MARIAGRIASWNDEKGYGFILPDDQGERVFVHIKAFERGSRRPVAGDAVSYSRVSDDRGRANAVKVRYAGAALTHRKGSAAFPRAFVACAFLLSAFVAALTGWIPWLLPIAWIVLSCVSLGAYGFDKAAARKGRQRTAESTLHLLDLLGGWPGGLMAQQWFRHKNVKGSFQLKFWITVAGNAVLMWWLVRSGTADALKGHWPG